MTLSHKVYGGPELPICTGPPLAALDGPKGMQAVHLGPVQLQRLPDKTQLLV